MKEEREEYYKEYWCYIHPEEVVVGVCHVCLKERLLMILATKKSLLTITRTRKPSLTLPNFFALGAGFFSRHRRSESYSGATNASSSREDSFISIKFEENGVASWEKGKASMSLDHGPNHSISHEDKGVKSVLGPLKKTRGSLRWQKRIGHLFQVIRRTRSNHHHNNNYKGNVCHVGSSSGSKVEGVKVRHGWIKPLTKRRTKE